MTFRSHIGALSFLAAGLLSCGALADLGEDTHIQESGEIRIEVDRRVFEEFARLFDLGYPPASIMMHAVSRGMSINDIVYIAVKADVSRAQEYYDTAASLLPALPGWVCQAESDPGRYTRSLDPGDLGEDPSLRQVAQVYFDTGQRLVPFPEWQQGRVHMEASVDELSELVSGQKWYVAGPDDGTPRTAPNRPIFVSLYRHNGDIVVDGGVERIRRAREEGVERLPVVLVFNDSSQRPVGAFGEDVTVSELAERFYGDGIELTAVPEWQVGDYHKMARLEELRELVEVPEQEDVLARRWDQVEQTLRDNDMAPAQPLLITLVRSGQGRAWINDPTKVAVAQELGIESLPVVLFYHRIDRRACGQPSNCEDLLCEAATAAGASAEVCADAGESTLSAAAGGRTPDAQAGNLAFVVDPQLYEGLSYTQTQCRS